MQQSKPGYRSLNIFLLSFILLFGTIYAQPKIKIIGKPEFSFGKVYEGSKPVHKIKIMNVGNQPLIISRVVAVCECSILHLDSYTILPQKKTTLTVTFKTNGLEGYNKKSFSITSNDMSQHTIIIPFTADVITLLEVEPRRLYFKNQECVAGDYKILSLKNTSKKTLNILKIFDPTDIVTVQLQRKIMQPGETINAQVLAKPVDETSRSGEIVIRTDIKLQPELRVKYLIQGSK